MKIKEIVTLMLLLVSVSFSQTITGACGYNFGDVITDGYLDSSVNENVYSYYCLKDVELDTPIAGISTVRLFASPITKKIYKIMLIDWVENSDERQGVYINLMQLLQNKYGKFEFFSFFVEYYSKTIGNVDIHIQQKCLVGTAVWVSYTNSVSENRMETESITVRKQKIKELQKNTNLNLL